MERFVICVWPDRPSRSPPPPIAPPFTSPPMPPRPPQGASGQQLVGGLVGVHNQGVAPPPPPKGSERSILGAEKAKGIGVVLEYPRLCLAHPVGASIQMLDFGSFAGCFFTLKRG